MHLIIKNTLALLVGLMVLLLAVNTAQAQVIYANNFSSANWQTGLSFETGLGGSKNPDVKRLTNSAYCATGRSCLRIRVKNGSHYGSSIKYNFPKKPQSAYLRYRVRYESSFNQFTGKTIGFEHTGAHGNGGRKPDGKNGWSARSSAKGTKSYLENKSYVYHVHQNQSFGDTWTWNTGGRMQYGKWYDVEIYTKVNNPGQRNGVIKAWVDGKQVYQKTNITFTHTAVNEYNKIRSVWINYYHGGPNKSPKNATVYIDDLAVKLGSRVGQGSIPENLDGTTNTAEGCTQQTLNVATANNQTFAPGSTVTIAGNVNSCVKSISVKEITNGANTWLASTASHAAFSIHFNTDKLGGIGTRNLLVYTKGVDGTWGPSKKLDIIVKNNSTTGNNTPPAHGQIIWIKASTNNRYVTVNTAASNALQASKTSVGTKEKYTVQVIGSKYFFKSKANNLYIQNKENRTDAPMYATGKSTGGWESYEWVARADGGFSLKARNGKYVQARSNVANVPLVARGTRTGGWEKFTWGAP